MPVLPERYRAWQPSVVSWNLPCNKKEDTRNSVTLRVRTSNLDDRWPLAEVGNRGEFSIPEMSRQSPSRNLYEADKAL